MRFAVASYHVPDPHGSAAGRVLYATVEGLLALGHEVRVWSWGGTQPSIDLPGWCEWHPVPAAGRLRVRARALCWPRSEVVRARWPFPDEAWRARAIAVGDDFQSFPAVAGHDRSVLTLHYATALDEAALGHRSMAGMQERRAERRASRRAALVLAYSERVARASAARAVAIPAAYPVAPAPRPQVEQPVAAIAADWRWPPNRWALDRLLRSWPTVRSAVPAARLRLAGWGLDDVGAVAGVEVLGRIRSTESLLAEAALVPFPCPPTSGPKVKVLEAMALGIPVVCTPAGVEGVADGSGPGAVLTEPLPSADSFGTTLARALADPATRAEVGAAGRAAVLDVHAPVPAARARVRACATLFDASDQGAGAS